MNIFKNLYKYREFLKTSVKKEFRGKYKKSFLGILWSFLNPLFQLLIYALVFPFILKNNIENYTVFLIVALFPWNFFNLSIIQSSACIVANGGIIKKVYFPREILPISTATSNLINFLITEIIVFVFLFVSGIGISSTIFVFPLIVLIQFILQLGLSFILSAITVYVRDVEYLINVIMMLAFYLSPIVYSADMIPAKFLPLFKFIDSIPIKIKRKDGKTSYVDLNNYIVNLLTRMIPPTYEEEALKSAAIIVRANVFRSLYENNYVNEEEYQSINTFQKMWKNNFWSNFDKLKDAVEETSYQYLANKNKYYFDFDIRDKYKVPFSSYGANMLAKSGYKYHDILHHYYPDAFLEIV